MKKVLFLFAMITMMGSVKAYDFSAETLSGQTLYYEYWNDGVRITYPRYYNGYYDPTYYYGFAKPTGVIFIPETVMAPDGNEYNVVSINSCAFYGCYDLILISIPETINNIGENAFYGTGSVVLYAGNASGSPWGASNHYPVNYYEENGLYFFDSTKTVLFLCEDSITSLNIPNTVTSIYEYAFHGHTGINSVSFPSSLQTIGRYAFQGCTGITTISFPNTLQTIGDRAFQGCSNLIALNIPNSVTTLSACAFEGCSNLTSVSIGDGVSSIGSGAFDGCTRLTSVSLGENVQTIGNYSFRNCGIIGELVIPQGVISIGGEGFAYCYGITEITCLGRVAPILSSPDTTYDISGGSIVTIITQSTFYGVSADVPVNIPCGTINLYAGRWSHFHNFNEIPFQFAVVSADLAMDTVAMLQEPTCDDPIAIVEATPRSGYRFDHWSDGSTANPYTYTAMGSLTLKAYFASTTEDIENIDDAGIILYTKDYQIHINNAIGEDITIYTIDGRTVALLPKATEHVAIPVSTTGVYIVKVGEHPARKVVVIK